MVIYPVSTSEEKAIRLVSSVAATVAVGITLLLGMISVAAA